MATITTGRHASVSTATGAVTYLGSWNLTKDSGIVSTNHFGTYNATNIGSINSWTASVEGFLAFDDAAQKALIAAQEAQTEVTLTLYVNSTTTYWSSTSVLISSINITAATADVNKITIEFVPGSDATNSAMEFTTPA